LVLPFWYRLTQVVLEKRPLNGCSNGCSISQVIGSEDRLRNDLYCVEWGVKLYSNSNLPRTVDVLYGSSSCTSKEVYVTSRNLARRTMMRLAICRLSVRMSNRSESGSGVRVQI